MGGHEKGLSNLAKAGKLDVRSEIAAAAGVSAGNVTKVKQLLANAHPDVLQSLRADEISIHCAWLWSRQSPDAQRKELWRYQGEAGVRKTIRQLVSRHKPTSPQAAIHFDELMRCLRRFNPNPPDQIAVSVIEAPGKGIFLTEELFRTLSSSQQELLPVCDMNNR